MNNTDSTKEQLLIELSDLRKAFDSIRKQHEEGIALLKKAEARATKSEEKYRKAFMTSPDAVNINRLSDGMYVSVNEGFSKILGYPEEEVIGKTSLELNVWVDQEIRKLLVSILQEHDSVENFEALFRRKDGTIVNGLMSATLLELDGVTHVLSETKDITHRIKVDEELAQEQFLVNALMKNLTDHVYFKDLDSRFIRINNSHALSFGLNNPDEAIGKTDFDFFTEEHARQAYEDEQFIIRTGVPVNKEEKLTRENLPDKWSSSIKLPLLDNDGKTIGTFGISRDITSRMEANEAFRRLSLRQEAILEAVPEIMMEVDMNKVYTWANRHGIDFFGEDVIGKEASYYFEGEQETYNAVHPVFNGDSSLFYVESWQRRSDGEKRLIAWWCQSIKDDQGNVTGALSSARDITEQKKSEEQLFLLANAIKSINDSVSITDMKDNVLFLNKAFYDTYGFDKDDFKEKNIRLIRSRNNPPEIADRILPETLLGGWHGELINCKKDGSEFPVFLSTSVVKNDEGEPTALIGVATDITERKKTEAALRQSEERFRSVTQSANDAIITVNGKGEILAWNRGAEIAFGYSESEIVGLSLNLIIPEDYLDKHIKGMVRLEMRGEKKVIGKTVELNGKKKNGDTFPLELSLSDWETSEGKFFTGIIRDISRRKRTELEARVIYEITHGITTTSNLDELLKLIHQSLGKVVYADNCFVALHNPKTGLFSFPYFVDKFDTTPLPTSMGKSCTAYVFRTVRPFLFTSDVFNRLHEQNEVELVGSPSPSWIGIPLQSPSAVIGVLVLQHYEKENIYSERDLDFLISIGSQIAIAIERKKSEEEIKLKNELLQTLNAEKDKFFSIIAHDLKGPMSAFVAVTQILTEDIQNMTLDEIRDITISMKTDATNIYKLLENLLEWSRLKRGVMEFKPEKLNIRKMISTGIEVVSMPARNKGIEIVIDVPVNLDVTADAHMFETVIRNLVSNSVKFTTTGGKVIVSASVNQDNDIEIRISDNGIGMTPELKSKLFMLNEKTSRPGTEGESSTGLGLLLCKEFIEKHDGRIWVESEVGKGSVFNFTIPESVKV
jgi:PAS domain S-box-containing protein